ncbi:cobalt ECF transporter T component CbiQ [Geoalkalibacter halelectricus]|uniref:Cobalt ECF transporter T component CbiQ n=1 Tax=Geoalkalibacter halelectricus TaxID=2847045 RepID=A0ABY5ZNS0_9BACT|nr:cobalt ECF transporter T component CbiQ [Geoalkalibacter halelectricus]MDO3377493.1 cobalt ECF transporter T component CbiQ [Geoalkalibacter halelectricus]UWZ80746.1 cobalt ECF transporter T component CbiQ [Geoalkalibacter halelectricus]
MAVLPGSTLEAAPGILPAAVLILAGGGVLAVLLLKRAAARAQSSCPEQNWSVPTIDHAQAGDSLFHRWDVRFKLVGLLSLAFFMVATRSLAGGLLALGLAGIAAVAARVCWKRVARRLLAMAGFLAMFLLIMPLTAAVQPGDTLVIFPEIAALAFNLRGLELALAICAKAFAVALLMEPLFATAPLSTTLEGLSRLGVPARVSQMILLAHRYIFVFLDEARRMSIGMNVRGFRKRTRVETLRVMGNFLGMLFIRSFERTHRVHDAMQARGFEGEFPRQAAFDARGGDWLKGAGCLILGLALVLIDRLWF